MKRCLPSRCYQAKPRRPALWLLALPACPYLLTPWLANRIQPVILGLPFMVFYTAAVTLFTGLVMALVAWLDPLYRANAPEHVPADCPADQNSRQP